MNQKNIFSIFRFAVVFFAMCCYLTTFSQNTKFTVVIDAGHGGHDPGAMGKISREKDINLSVSLQLGELIATNYSDVKVVYTRNTDKYLTLQERADIVNNNHADLFICIHTNSAQSSSAYGTESFTLGLAKTKGNLDVAMRENAVMLLEDDYKSKYKGFDPTSVDSYIMFEFMQDKYIDRSISIASDIQNHFKNYAGRSDRGVRQAGFWVLYRSACPSVLIELGFISNTSEEKFLASASGQKEMSESIFKAFVSFKYENDKKLGKTTKKPNFSESESLKIDDVGRFDKRTEGTSAPLKPVVANTKEAVVPQKDIVKPAIVVNETTQSASTKKTNEKKQKEVTNLTEEISENTDVKKTETEKPTTSKKEKNKKESSVSTSENSKPSNDIITESLSKDKTKLSKQNKVSEDTSQTENEIKTQKSETTSANTNQNIAIKRQESTTNETVRPATTATQRVNTPISADKQKYVDMNAYAAATEHPVYKLQLFASTKKLNSNAADFRGIRNTDFFIENGMYKYTIGSDTKYEVITKLRKEMLPLFPDAFVIAFLGKSKIHINEALKLTNKKK